VVNSRATRCSGWFALGRHSLDPRRIARPWSMAEYRYHSPGDRWADGRLCGCAKTRARSGPADARAFVIDVLLVTWLIWITNDIHSPYTALYIVIISLASVFLGPRDAIIASVGCAAAFTVCALGVNCGAWSTPTQTIIEGSLANTIQSLDSLISLFLSWAFCRRGWPNASRDLTFG